MSKDELTRRTTCASAPVERKYAMSRIGSGMYGFLHNDKQSYVIVGRFAGEWGGFGAPLVWGLRWNYGHFGLDEYDARVKALDEALEKHHRFDNHAWAESLHEEFTTWLAERMGDDPDGYPTRQAAIQAALGGSS